MTDASRYPQQSKELQLLAMRQEVRPAREPQDTLDTTHRHQELRLQYVRNEVLYKGMLTRRRNSIIKKRKNFFFVFFFYIYKKAALLLLCNN